MKIEPKAFIAIEMTMAAAMRSQWDAVARKLLDKLHPLIEAKKWGEAQEAVNRLTLDGIVSEVRPKIEEMCVSALLFGAHHATGDVKATSFAKGKKLPQELHNAIAQLEHMVEDNGRDYVCDQLHSMIEALKRADETAHLQKDDLSDEQLAETGGLQEPEQARLPRKAKRKQQLTKTEGPKTLYVNRPLLNADEVIAWAKEQGFGHAQKPEDMHVTICYSKTPFDWDDLQPKLDNVTVVGGAREVKVFGKAIVLTFDSDILQKDHQELRDAGASYDFDEYRPHVTITWEEPPEPFEDIEPFAGDLQFGPEVFKAIDQDWQKDHQELALKWERLFKADDRSLAEKLNDAVRRGGAVPIDAGAQLTTSRLVSLGFLAQAVDQGLTTYVVNEVLDDRTCPVCQYMHGKTFSVQQQYDRTIQQLAAADPDSLRDLAPWPGQSEADMKDLHALSGAELQAQGYGAPPYHPGCRGMITMVGTATETIPLGGPARADYDALASLAIAATEAEEKIAPPTLPDASWTPEMIEHLKWRRFDVTDPHALAEVNDLFDAGEYEAVQQMVDQWKSLHSVAKGDKDETQGFDGPNAPRKKRKPQTPASREQDYSDISFDSSSLAVDSGVSNDALAPLDSF